MAKPRFTMRQLLEAGVHFGHHKQRWNPKMEKFIFGTRNNVHIFDLEKTAKHLHHALNMIKEVSANGGKVLFVGTKRQAAEKIEQTAQECGQYYVNHRWFCLLYTSDAADE